MSPCVTPQVPHPGSWTWIHQIMGQALEIQGWASQMWSVPHPASWRRKVTMRFDEDSDKGSAGSSRSYLIVEVSKDLPEEMTCTLRPEAWRGFSRPRVGGKLFSAKGRACKRDWRKGWRVCGMSLEPQGVRHGCSRENVMGPGWGQDGEVDEIQPWREVTWYPKGSGKLLMGFLGLSQLHNGPKKGRNQWWCQWKKTKLPRLVPDEKSKKAKTKTGS